MLQLHSAVQVTMTPCAAWRICLQELSALVGEMEAKGHAAEALIHAIAKEAGVMKLAHAGRSRIEKAIRHHRSD